MSGRPVARGERGAASPPDRAHSLRARLLWLLFGSVTAVALIQAVTAYRLSLAEADALFDYQMKQMALAVGAGGPLYSPPAGTATEELDFVVQINTPDGALVYRSSRVRVLPVRPVVGYSEERVDGALYRVYTLRSGNWLVRIAQDIEARTAMARQMALKGALPAMVLVPLLLLLVWGVIQRSLAPIERVRRQLSERQASDLSPVSAQGLPAEVQPLAVEINHLFERVSQAFEAQNHFVADAAHELRSPLAALKLQVQNLSRRKDPLKQGYALRRLEQGVDRASRLVEQLLALARHQAAIGDGAPTESLALGPLVAGVITELLPMADARHIDLGLAREDSVTVDAHAEPLRILARNLVENALKYAPDGGTVDVSVLDDAAGGVLVIEDSGPGIDDTERARVFDRFYRVASTGSAAGVEGSGLGLAIVRSIADQYGARVALERSERLGGLRVVVRFARGLPFGQRADREHESACPEESASSA